MKILKNNCNEEKVKNIAKTFNVRCDKCDSELEITKEDTHIGWLGAVHITCPCCGEESMVDEIFKKRFRDNQLNKAQITLNELHKVRESFVNNLISMRHGRISYHKDENSGNEDENDLFVAAAGEQQGESKKTEEIY